ncbi:MAG: hypothetical protein F6K58_32200 [Symploca sp. SIO2E9]|nr:hypothetical protein [Symploca sp. SIO2E9]
MDNLLLANCQLSIKNEEFCVYAPSELVAIALRRSSKQLAQWAERFHAKWTLIFFPGCEDKPYQIPVVLASSMGEAGDDLVEQLNSPSRADAKEDLKIIEQIIDSELPAGIAGLECDGMIWANPALIRIVREDDATITSLEAQTRSTRACWQNQAVLEEVKQTLRQQSILENFAYEAELNPGSGRSYNIRGSFEAIWLPGRQQWCRRVTMLEHSPVMAISA